MDSILSSVKKLLGLDAEYEQFDPEIILAINAVFMTLNQLGVGPEEGFSIEDASAVWSDFLGERNDLNAVKTYVYIKVKLAWDPPQTSYLITNLKEQAQELEWRLNIQAEGESQNDRT